MAGIIVKDYTDYLKGRDWIHMLGFCAPDWRGFMTEHNRLFGSGPFFYTTNTFGKLLYRGDEVDCEGLEFHACYGAWGSHSIEVVQPNPFEVPTMFSEFNEPDKPGFNHIHMFVESLEEAQDACDFLGLPVITVGYPDLENALEKARATGADVEAIKANAGKPSFTSSSVSPCSSWSRAPSSCMTPSSGPARSGTVPRRRCSSRWASIVCGNTQVQH